MLFSSLYGVLISKNGAGPSGPAPFLLPHSHCVASALGSSWRLFWLASGRCVVRRTGSEPAAACSGGSATSEAARRRSNRAPHGPLRGAGDARPARHQPAPPRGGYPNTGRHCPPFVSGKSINRKSQKSALPRVTIFSC